MNTETAAPRLIGSSDLLGWLRGKLADAEKSLRCREDMANAKPISEEEWEKLKAMPGVRITKGRKLTKVELKDLAEEPLRQKRIAIKCRHEVEMFKATIAALTQPNVPAEERLTETPITERNQNDG